MSYMFDGCANLSMLNVSSFNTSNVTNMAQMFFSCTRLTTLDLSSFETRNVRNMNGMFDYNPNLKTFKIGKYFKFVGTSHKFPDGTWQSSDGTRWLVGSSSASPFPTNKADTYTKVA